MTRPQPENERGSLEECPCRWVLLTTSTYEAPEPITSLDVGFGTASAPQQHRIAGDRSFTETAMGNGTIEVFSHSAMVMNRAIPPQQNASFDSFRVTFVFHRVANTSNPIVSLQKEIRHDPSLCSQDIDLQEAATPPARRTA